MCNPKRTTWLGVCRKSPWGLLCTGWLTDGQPSRLADFPPVKSASLQVRWSVDIWIQPWIQPETQDTWRHWWTVEERLKDSTSDWLLCRQYITFRQLAFFLSFLIPARASQPRCYPFWPNPNQHLKSSSFEQFGKLFFYKSSIINIYI